MPPIRRLLAVAALVAGGLLAGCGDAPTAASTPSPPSDTPSLPSPNPALAPGTYALHTAAGNTPPAHIHRFVEAETQEVYDVYVTSDTLEVTASGRYVQRAVLEVRAGTQLVGRSRWTDRGVYAGTADALRFESDYFQNVRFAGAVQADGAVHVVQDLPREGTVAAYVFRRLP